MLREGLCAKFDVTVDLHAFQLVFGVCGGRSWLRIPGVFCEAKFGILIGQGSCVARGDGGVASTFQFGVTVCGLGMWSETAVPQLSAQLSPLLEYIHNAITIGRLTSWDRGTQQPEGSFPVAV